MRKRFIKFWDKINNVFHWLFRDDHLFFGEIELLHGRHDLALPLEEYEILPCDIKEVWVSFDDRVSKIPTCCGDDIKNWFTIQVCCDEVRIHTQVNTDKVLLKWFILI